MREIRNLGDGQFVQFSCKLKIMRLMSQTEQKAADKAILFQCDSQTYKVCLIDYELVSRYGGSYGGRFRTFWLGLGKQKQHFLSLKFGERRHYLGKRIFRLLSSLYRKLFRQRMIRSLSFFMRCSEHTLELENLMCSEKKMRQGYHEKIKKDQ